MTYIIFKKIKLFATICGALTVFSSTVYSEETNATNEMSLSSVILFALDNNPDIEMAKQRHLQGAYVVKDSKSAYYPKVTLNAEWGREYNQPFVGDSSGGGDLNSTGSAVLLVQQLIYDGFSTTQNIKSQEELYKSLGVKTKIKVDSVISGCIKYYLDIYHYQKAIKESQNYYNNIKKIVSTVNQMHKEGAASKASEDYALARMAMARSELSEIRSSLTNSVSNLEFLTGYIPSFTATDPDVFNPKEMDIGFYLDYAKKNNANMLLNSFDKNSVDHKLKSMEGSFHPKFKFNFEAEDKENSGGKAGRQRSASALVNMEYKLYDGYSRKSNIGKLKSQFNELEIKDQKILKKLKKDIQLSYNQITLLQENLKATELEIRANASVKDINNINFEHGEINIIDLMDGEDKLKNSRIRQHKLESELYFNIYRLLITSGVLDELYFCETCDFTEDREGDD